MNLKKYVLILGLILASICFVSAISAASLDEMGQSDSVLASNADIAGVDQSSSDAQDTKDLQEVKNSVELLSTALKTDPQKVMKYGSEPDNQKNTDQPSDSTSNTQKNPPRQGMKIIVIKSPKFIAPILRLIFKIKKDV